MALTQTQVSQLYVSLFGRASEGEGNTFWQAESNMTTAANAMLATTAATTYFGGTLSNQAFVEYIYLNTLGKTYAQDTAGVDFWVNALSNPANSRGFVVSELINSAVTIQATAPTDASNQFTNRVAVSDYTATTLATAPADYATSTAFNSANKPTGALTVTHVASTVDTAKAAIVTLVPHTFTLTTGTETVTGTANNDTINGVTSTLTSAKTFDTTDIIDGGAGTDTMNITMNSSFTGMTGTGAVSNVENIALTNASTVARTFDATGITGATAYTIDATNAGVSISDMSAIAAVSVTGQASGTFSTAMDTTFVALAGTADAMTFNVTNVGTADNVATTSTNEEAAVTSTLTSMETINVNATGTNVLAFGGTATTLNIAGSGNVKVTAVSTTTTTVDASESTGVITLDTTAAAANALTSVATGSGADTITLDTADMLANGTISGGDGADSLAVTSGAKTVQYAMSGVETVALTAVTGALIFSGTNTSGITTVSTVAANTAATSFVGMNAGDLTINAIGATVDAGDLSSTHTGATTLNFSVVAADVTAKTERASAADFTLTGTSDLTVNVGQYIDTDAVITAAVATSVALNVASGMSSATTPVQLTTFDGAITAAAATSFTAVIDGQIGETAAAVITVDAATEATITNNSTAGAIDLQGAALENLTVTSAKAFTMTGSDLSAVQVADITVNDGAFTGVTMADIATLTIAGSGVTNATAGTTASSFASVNLGGDNAYSMNVTASGMKGGVTLGTVDTGAGYDITIEASEMTGALAVGHINADGVGTAAGKNVTVTTAGTAGAVDLSNITATGLVTLTNSGAGAYDVDTISTATATIDTTGTVGAVDVGAITATGTVSITNASSSTFALDALSAGVTGDVTVALDGTVGAVSLSTIAGKTVNLDVSNTIAGTTYGTITALNSATVALSELQNNTVAITAAAASTTFTAAVTGGIGNDAITITGVATNTSITASGDYGIGDNTLTIDNDVSSNAADTITVTATNYDFSKILGGDAASTITGGANADYIVTAKVDGENDIDTAIGGAGNDTYATIDGGEADIIVEGASAGTDTILAVGDTSIEGFKYHATTASSAVADASLANIEQIVITDAKTLTVDSDQVTGLTLAINSTADVTGSVLAIVGDATADTIDISDFTVASVTYTGSALANAAGSAFDTTNDDITIAGGDGIDTITLNALTADTVVFAATAAGNDADIINEFDFTSDSMDFSAFIGSSVGITTTAVNFVTGAADFSTTEGGVVFNHTGDLVAADIATDTATSKIKLVNNQKAVIFVSADADGTADATVNNYNIYYVQDTDATAGVTWAVTLVGTITNATEVSSGTMDGITLL